MEKRKLWTKQRQLKQKASKIRLLLFFPYRTSLYSTMPTTQQLETTKNQYKEDYKKKLINLKLNHEKNVTGYKEIDIFHWKQNLTHKQV